MLKHFSKGKIKIFKLYNDIFTGEIKRNYAITYLPIAKSCLLVYSKKEASKIFLKGNWTKFLDCNLSASKQSEIINLVNSMRNYQLGKAYHFFDFSKEEK